MNEELRKFEELKKEGEEREERMRKVEEEGVKNIIKYFDRIHDKLFTFNNFLIAGYFALSKIETTVPVKSIIFPISNMILLIYVEYRMMEKSRYESEITKKPINEILSYGEQITKINLYSLSIIGTTLFVTLIFLFYLFKYF